MDLEDAEAKVHAAVEAARDAVGPGGTVSPVESTGRQRCQEGLTLRFRGRYQTSLSLEVRAPSQEGLDPAAAAIEARWRADGWGVQSERLADAPTRELAAEDDDFDLKVRFFDDAGGGFLRVSATTPCARPRAEIPGE